jgi:hypothetical protein
MTRGIAATEPVLQAATQRDAQYTVDGKDIVERLISDIPVRYLQYLVYK